MSVEEIKGIIKELTNGVTEDNAQGIASSLNELNQFIHGQFSNSELAKEFNQLPNVTTAKIKSLEEKNQVLANEIQATEGLLKQKADIEKKYDQLLLEREKRNKLEEKANAIKELSQIQSKVLDLEKTNTASMEANIENLQKLNVVLANANTNLEMTFAANILTAANNLSAIQKKVAQYPFTEVVIEEPGNIDLFSTFVFFVKQNLFPII